MRNRRRRDRVRRIDPAAQRIDLVLREQFLHRGARIGAAGVFRIALDQGDLVGLHLVGMKLEIKLHAAIDLLRQFCADAGIRQDHADLDLLGHGDARCGDQNGSRHHPLLQHHDDLPLAWRLSALFGRNL
jgi:hypothetical protein